MRSLIKISTNLSSSIVICTFSTISYLYEVKKSLNISTTTTNNKIIILSDGIICSE